MSAPAAIAAVTRTLAGLLEAALQAEDPSYRVTNLPPDRSNAETQFANRLNLFLVQPSYNAALRNTNNTYASAHGDAAQPPLAIDLTYMITTYGEATPETKDQRILGLAMQFLDDHPVLLAEDIRNSFPGTGLEDQAERVKIRPRVLSLEEMSRLWATFLTQYRTSATYDVSVVLVDSAVPAPAGSPVLRRGEDDRGTNARAALPPVLTAVRPPELLRRFGQATFQPAIRLAETLTLEGERLPEAGAALELRSPAWEPRSALITGSAPVPRPGTLEFVLPAAPPEQDAPPPPAVPLAWSPGVYTAALRVPSPAGPDAVSNAIPFALAPQVQINPANAPPGTVDLTIDCLPAPRPEQTVVLLLSGREPLSPTSITRPPGQPAAIAFTAAGLTPGQYLVRLRVDGVDSLPYRVVDLPGGGKALDHDPSDVLVIA